MAVRRASLTTLRDASHYLAKTIPKAERYHEEVLTASDQLTRSAEQGYPLFFARAATLQGYIAIGSACSIQSAKTITGENAS